MLRQCKICASEFLPHHNNETNWYCSRGCSNEAQRIARLSRRDIQLTAERLQELLCYEPDTGLFRHRARRMGVPLAGALAGSVGAHGYVNIWADGRLYRAHRVAWLYVYRRWPEEQIDHVNGLRADNRIANLREATQSQNNVNSRGRSKTGLRGIYFDKKSEKWAAEVVRNRKKVHIGTFETAEAAHDAYVKEASVIYGEFVRIGRERQPGSGAKEGASS